MLLCLLARSSRHERGLGGIMLFRLLPIFSTSTPADSLGSPPVTGASTMRVVDAKSGAEAAVDLRGLKGAVLRALVSSLADLSDALSAGDAAPMQASGLVDADWDETRLASTMPRVVDAALRELRCWLPPPASASSLGFGFEAEIVRHETQTHVYPPPAHVAPSHPQGTECPGALRVLSLRGLWRLMRLGEEGTGICEREDAKEVLFVLEHARPLVTEEWKDAIAGLVSVCAACEGNSFLIWG
ncbi:hypothetical protein AURDEDRAFT_127485 [Auricularia subglabra TFB-10046 SS5]|nr:hypothetical protein AURDEDRAFT_127485 [Auricularia subglabra TFB-10046 SS5]